MKKNLFILFFTISLALSQAFCMNYSQPNDEKEQQNTKKALVLYTPPQTVSLNNQSAQDSNAIKSSCISSIKKFTKTTVRIGVDTTIQLLSIPALLSFFLAIHEFGHYSVAKLFAPESNPEIHLFSTACKPALFTIGDLSVHTETLMYSITLIAPLLNSTMDACIVAAGPSAGLFAIYLFFFAKTFIQKYKDTKNLRSAFAFARAHGHTPFENILAQKDLSSWQFLVRLFVTFLSTNTMFNHIVYGFFPLAMEGNLKGDGWRLWQYFFNKDQYFRHSRCELADEIAKNITQNDSFMPIATKYMNKNIFQNQKYIQQIQELISSKGSDWCKNLHKKDLRVGKTSNITMLSFSIIGILALLLKTGNTFSSFMFNEKTIFHAGLNKIIYPTVHVVISIPSQVIATASAFWSYISYKINGITPTTTDEIQDKKNQ